MAPNDLEFYHDTIQDWTDALLAFQKVKEELFKTYSITYKSGNKFKRSCIKGLELTADQLFELFHKHLEQYTNKTVRYFIFHWWNDLRYYIEGAQPTLDCPWELYKEATKEEIEQANKNFIGHTFNSGRILEYRGIRFPIDDEWNDAWIVAKDGHVRSFQLVWDW